MAIQFKARVLLELGAELISSDAVALYELVKNAIDAQATKVRIDVDIVLQHSAFTALHRWLSTADSDEFDAAEFKDALKKVIEPAAPETASQAFWAALGEPTTPDDAAERLTEAFFAGNNMRIADNGSGMTQDILRLGYLTVGTPLRLLQKPQKSSPRWTAPAPEEPRPALGEKGIGRLAAMRLGHYIHVQTATRDDASFNVLELDWRPIFADPTLDAAALDYAPEPGDEKPEPELAGTLITVRDLQSDWTEEKLQSLANSELAKLGDPFASDFINDFIELNLQGRRVWLPEFDESRFDMADAVCTATFGVKTRDNGDIPANPHLGDLELDVSVDYRRFSQQRHWKVVGAYLKSSVSEPVIKRKGSKNNALLPDSDAVTAALSRLGPFEMKFYWFNRGRLRKEAPEAWGGGLENFVRRWSGGLLVYRDGFRVYPYGAPSDDWLDLDRNALSASQYKLNRAQIVGYLRISHEGNPTLLDQTNREGFRDGPEKEALRRLLRHVIISKCRRFLEAIDKEAKNTPESVEELEDRVNHAERETVKQVRQLGARVPQEQEAIQEILFQLGELHDAWERAKAKIRNHEDELEQYIHLAGVGLQVEFLAHELARISGNTLQLLDKENNDITSMRRGLRAQLKTLDKKIRTLDALSIPGRQRKITVDLRDVLSTFKDMHYVKADRHGIGFDVVCNSDAPFPVHIELGQIIQILDNLFSNSFYWLGARIDTRKRPQITLTVHPDRRTLEFHDNGPGVPPDMTEDIFKPFVTTKPDKEGRGLGLFISKRLAEYNDVDLQLGRPGDDGHYHAFILKFNTPKK